MSVQGPLDALRGYADSIHDQCDEMEDALKSALAGGPHRVTHIWLEDRDEVSWKCACGFTTKHQRLYIAGASVEVGLCPDAG